MAYVPVALMLAGMTAYTVLAGADFGAGLWMLLAVGPDGQPTRSQARHAMGPVWEANHVWLIFVLVLCWTAYPVAFGSIASTLAIPLTAAAVGIIFRGAAYALRGQGASRAAETVLALSSVLTPFALGTVVGAIATGRVPVGNAAGNLITSWLNAPSILTGVLAVAFSGYLAAVYLAADSRRIATAAGRGQSPGRPGSPGDLVRLFRRRALAAGVVSGGLALAGLIVLRHSGLNLTHGLSLVMVCVSAVAGLATIALCWRSRFGLARVSAALAVAAVVVGWAAAQTPRMLPGLTVSQAAAGRATLVAIDIAVGGGAVILIPSLLLLYALFLRGRLDAPETAHVHLEPLPASAPPGPGAGAVAAGPAPAAAARAAAGPDEAAAPAGAEPGEAGTRASGAIAIAGLIAGTGLLVFTDMPWTHGLGVACLVLCAVFAFRLAVLSHRQRGSLAARRKHPPQPARGRLRQRWDGCYRPIASPMAEKSAP